MTAIWEQASDEIEAGRMPLEKFLTGQSVWIGKLVEQCSTLSLTIDQPPSPPCPICGSPTKKRTGKNGAFLSCSKYPDCKGILNLAPAKKTRKR